MLKLVVFYNKENKEAKEKERRVDKEFGPIIFFLLLGHTSFLTEADKKKNLSSVTWSRINGIKGFFP